MTSKDKSAVSATEELPRDFEQQAQRRFEKLESPELDFKQYLESETIEYFRRQELQKNPALLYVPTLGTMTQCGNGDFEEGLINPAEWQGAYGPLQDGSGNIGNINFSILTAGLFPGALNLGISTPSNFALQSHQTCVGVGPDPYLITFASPVNLPQTAPTSSAAARIGNRVWGGGCELLSKTFLVTAANRLMTFWYAVVFQNPNDGIHSTPAKPYFRVRVTQGSVVVPGAVNFGNFGGGAMLTSDAANPFFQNAPDPIAPGQFIVYKDWAAAQIDLSSLAIGSTVTIEFVSADCWHTGHFGYAYIDRLCSTTKGSPEGSISYDCEGSSHCGPGKICFDYELPHATGPDGNVITGAVTITLDILQNGVVLTTLTSPVLTSGSSYCFGITPASIPGINLSLGGFDFAATGAFSITSGSVTTSLGLIKDGTAPDGMMPGQNNDYLIACKSCEEIEAEQNEYLNKNCSGKANHLAKISCHCPDSQPGKGGCGCGGHEGPADGHDHGQGGGGHDDGGCDCKCEKVKIPEIKPCISVAWGDSKCDCMETDDVEIMCITVCNCYSNITMGDLSIGHIGITDMAGNPVPTLPDGSPSVLVVPSGPICFGDIGPCSDDDNPSCVSRELVVYTRGAIGKDYKLSFEGVCFTVKHHFQSEACFVLTLCKDK